MLRKKPTKKPFNWEDTMQAISTLIVTAIAVITIIVGLGQKLENLEVGQKIIKEEIAEISGTVKTLYTRHEAEKDFAIRDRLWEARYNATEQRQRK